MSYPPALPSHNGVPNCGDQISISKLEVEAPILRLMLNSLINLPEKSHAYLVISRNWGVLEFEFDMLNVIRWTQNLFRRDMGTWTLRAYCSLHDQQ